MITTLLVLVAGVIVGAVVSYLVLRANPAKKVKVDDFANDLSDKLKK